MSTLATTRFIQVTNARSRMTARSCEISGQCAKCLDLFTISVYLVHDQPAIADTPRLKWLVDDEGILTLIHRPELCYGKVTLYGSLEKLSLPAPTHYVLPRASAKSTSRGKLAPPRH